MTGSRSVLVITLGYPVLLDIEGSSLTQGVLKLFRRKLKNSIKIALIVKVELTSHYWYTCYGDTLNKYLFFLIDCTEVSLTSTTGNGNEKTLDHPHQHQPQKNRQRQGRELLHKQKEGPYLHLQIQGMNLNLVFIAQSRLEKWFFVPKSWSDMPMQS